MLKMKETQKHKRLLQKLSKADDKLNPLEQCELLEQLLLTFKRSQIANMLNVDTAWVTIRTKLRDASEDIKQLIRDGVIQDCRTLYELYRLEKLKQGVAQELIRQIRNNKISGPYREVIVRARRKRIYKPKKRKVFKAQQTGDSLVLYVVGQKSPLMFEIPKEVWS